MPAPLSITTHAITDAATRLDTTARRYACHHPPVARFLFAHGAGASQTHGFMVGLAEALTEHDVEVVTFDFWYMHAGRKLPDRQAALESCFASVAAWVRDTWPLAPETGFFIGGKSMGGRIATAVASLGPAPVAGVAALGYPLSPPRRTVAPRTAGLADGTVPLLVVQGTRDAFGTPEDVRAASAPRRAPCTVVAVDGADHAFAVRGRAPSDVYAEIAAAVAAWMAPHEGPPHVDDRGSSPMSLR